MDFINIKNVMKQYKNGVTAVYDVNLTINKGEFVFIMGASGSGKSTLIKLLYREEKPSKGEITLAGTNVAKLKNRKVFKLRRKLGIVFQDFRLLPKLTVYENVAFSLEILGLKKQEVREKTLKALDLVGLKSKVKDYPDQLSGGEHQRVVIDRAIENEPILLICDEQTGNLEQKTRMGFLKVIEEINELGTTVIMATHNVDIVKKLNKRVILMENGKVIKDYKEGTYKHEMD